MEQTHLLQTIANENRAGSGTGIYSCCSANEYVLRAAIRKAAEHDTPVLIEATANQVDQFGGYSGRTPEQFYAHVRQLAAESGLPEGRLILGGDHLGPLTFSDRPEREAMPLACDLVYAYAAAGFTKIHLDTSMRVADDDVTQRLPDEVIARRGAMLCKKAEEGYALRKQTVPNALPPVYIIGSEVPVPGGEQEQTAGIVPTDPEDLAHTYRAFEEAFAKEGLQDAFARVIGVVVQPGVEFGSEQVFVYDRENAGALTQAARTYPRIVLEGHSTDYQPRRALREMVQDGIAILKVGPALTFACREALFALETAEREMAARQPRLFADGLSAYRDTLEAAMMRDDGYWKKYYPGDGAEQKYLRAFSLSDRARYYAAEKDVADAAEKLLDNLTEQLVPYAVLSQYLPLQAWRIREGILLPSARDILEDHVGDVIEDYLYATGVTDRPVI